MTRIVKNSNVLHPELSYKIMGICFRVHNREGRFRNEQQYADALLEELKKSGLDFEHEIFLKPSFKGEKKNRNRPDFIIGTKMVLDIKAKRSISKEDYFQMQRYLAATKLDLGLIVNFRPAFLQYKRVLNSH